LLSLELQKKNASSFFFKFVLSTMNTPKTFNDEPKKSKKNRKFQTIELNYFQRHYLVLSCWKKHRTNHKKKTNK